MATGIDVDWELLAKAQNRYHDLGYRKTNVPWMVSREAICATFQGRNNPVFDDLHVVGSAEQSFVQLMIDRALVPGAYSALTPCFRDEKVIDELHQNSFAKVELFSYVQSNWNAEHILNFKITNAIQVMTELSNQPVKMVKTEEGFDLEMAGIEIGSFGIRRYNEFVWVYGTGLAEPRFSIAKLKSHNKV